VPHRMDIDLHDLGPNREPLTAPMSTASAKKEPKGCSAKTPRVLRARAVGNTYGVAFGNHIYAAACGAPPLALHRSTNSEAVPFYRKQGGKNEDLHDVAEEGCALPGEILVIDLEKAGWIRVAGGSSERWVPLQGGFERVEPAPNDGTRVAAVPPGWEVLTSQACQGAVLKTVVGGFEWGADAAVIQDAVQGRFLRVGTKRSDRPGCILGDAQDVSVAMDGTVSAGVDAVIITRPMIGISWGEDVFDVAGLLSDPGYVAAAATMFSVRPTQRELEAEAIETGQQALTAEVRGWFAPSPPSNVELVRMATREASALRRLWAHDLRERRHLRVHEGFVQIPQLASDGDEVDTAEASAAAAMSAAVAAAEEDFDPVQIWVQVALGSVLELAACIPPQPEQEECAPFERLIARGARTFATAGPLSLFGAGCTSRLCVEETAAALGALVASTPALMPVGLEMLLALATVTGSARLIAQALQWLLAGPEDMCAKRCMPNLRSLWQLGSVMHFESLKLLDKSDKRIDGKREPPSWRFVHLSNCSRAAPVDQRLRSHRTVSFEEPLPGGVFWEVTVLTADLRSVIVGVWLESKKKPIGCCLVDGSAVGAGAEASPADPLPEAMVGSTFGFVATAEDLVVTCDGLPFSRILYEKLLVSGERVAVCVEQGVGTELHLNVGQEPMRFFPGAEVGASAVQGSLAMPAPASARPLVWGRACDPHSMCPYEPFVETEPTTARELADHLLQMTERNVGRFGSAVDSGTPVQHTFAKSDQMEVTEDGAIVKNIRENSWARVDCEITVGVSVEFSFEVLDDRENDEGTCYGISTAECTKYDSRGSFVLRGYSGHLYCDGSDKGEKFPKIHPRSRVGFRFDYSEGRLEAWLDDQETRVLVSDPNLFAGRTLYPTVFNYHGTRTKVKLLTCNSGLRSRALLQDSFVLEVSAPAAALWIGILGQLLAPVRGLPPGSPEASAASGPIATVLKVLLATANVSPNIWVEFGAVREKLKEIIDFVVIERRNDPALRKPRDIGILLISALGVGALFGGPEQVLKVFLSVRDSEVSRLGQTLVAYLLKTRRSTSIAGPLILDLSRLAVSDELGCQILLRLALNAFVDGAVQLASIATGALELAGGALVEQKLSLLGDRVPSFFSELLPVLAQLLAALPRREPNMLPQLLELVSPVVKALVALRAAIVFEEPLPRFVVDVLQGLNSFVCGVAGLLMSPGDVKPFPLDIGDAELRDAAAGPIPPGSVFIAAEAMLDDILGPDVSHQVDEGPPLPEIVVEILGGTGWGESLVCMMHQKSPLRHQPVSPVQRAAFASAVLCKGPDFWEEIASDTSGAAAMAPWTTAQGFANNKVRSAKHSVAANEGNAAAFEAEIATRLTWLVKSLSWPGQETAPRADDLERAVTAPTTTTELLPRRKVSKVNLTVVERMRHLRRMQMGGIEAPGWHLNLSKAQAQLVDETAFGVGATNTDDLVAAAAAQRDVAIGRRSGLRLLRYLVRCAVNAEGVELLLPALHGALEETLSRPLVGLAHGGVSRKRAVLAELALLLRDVHDFCVDSGGVCNAAKSASMPLVTKSSATALSLVMMCVPLPREELEPLLGRLLGSFPAVALESRGSAGQGGAGYRHAHAAQLVLRAYISGRGRGGPALTALLAQIAALFDCVAVPDPVAESNFLTSSCLDRLEIDWDFGAFGRLCSRSLDTKAISEMLPFGGSATDGHGFERGSAMSLTLKDIRQQRANGSLPADAASNLLLRLPQGAHEDATVDAMEVLQALYASRGEEVVLPDDRKAGACVAALTLIRPVADLLTAEVPRIIERILRVATSGVTRRLPAALAVCLYMRIQLPDERVARDAPVLLELLGDAMLLATATGPAAEADAAGGKPRGALAFAALLARQLSSRAAAMAGTVLNMLRDLSVEHQPSSGALASLELIGGPMRCAACQMQVLTTSFGRSMVVAADAQHVAVLSLDGAIDAKAVQWMKWADLQVPACELAVTASMGNTCVWGESVVNCLLAAVQQLLASSGNKEQRLAPQLLRALTAVLPVAPRWDVAMVTEVVRELDELAGSGIGEFASGSIELVEHHCTLLRLALCSEEGPFSTSSPSSADATASAVLDSGTGRLSSMGGLRAYGVPSLLQVLNQETEWRGKYKLKRHTNTWCKSKWHFELRLNFRGHGELGAVGRWPKFTNPSTAVNASWQASQGGGVTVEFELELPGGRREGGRTRDGEAFTWKGRLVQSRGCPHFEGMASSRSSELKYEWYVVPPDPLLLLRATDLGLFGNQDEAMPRPFSLLSFNTGFVEQKAEHFSNTLGLSNFTKKDGTARDIAVTAVEQLSYYQFVNGPKEVARVVKESGEEAWGMRDGLQEDEDASGGSPASGGGGGDGGGGCIEERWRSVQEVFGEGSGIRSAGEILISLRREVRQLRHALLMRLLQVMLAHRPANTAIADSFPEPAAREAFFKRALRLPDASAVLRRCTEDFATSVGVAWSALTVAVEGLLSPFMAGGISTLTVESDHDYHPNEDWVFKLSIPGASRMRLRFDSRCKTESTRDFLQFFGERDTLGNFSRRLHDEEKLGGQYPSGFPDLQLPGDQVWLKFQSDGSQEYWGFKCTISAEGGCACALAVPFPAALKLLLAIAGSVDEEYRHGVRLMGSSVLLSVAATQPLSDEATRAAEAMCELLTEPCQWSDLSWCAVLSLVSIAERNGRRQLLASLVTLLSGQMGQPRAMARDVEVSSPLLLDHMSPSGAGVLLHQRTTLMAITEERVRAVGLPIKPLMRAGQALFCVRVEAKIGNSAHLGVGVALAASGDDQVVVCCNITDIASPEDELSIEVQHQGVGGDCLRLVVTARNGAVQRDLPQAWSGASSFLPVLQAEGFGTALSLQPSPRASNDSEAAAARLEQLQRTTGLVEACRSGRDESLPAALVVGAWARHEGGDEASIAAVQERLRTKCATAVESEHPHCWAVVTQKLEVPGAPALELTFPRVELAEGYCLRFTHDAAGELPVQRMRRPIDDGAVKHAIEFGKYLFMTLDCVDPEAREKGQQEGWHGLLPGWELAPSQADVIWDVVAKHRWGVDILVLASGDAFYTVSFEDGSKGGQRMGKDKLSTRGAGATTEYQPNGATARILARRLRHGCALGDRTAALCPEDLSSTECVVVPGSAVYVQGLVPQSVRWEPLPNDEGGESGAAAASAAAASDVDATCVGEDAGASLAAGAPFLCAGPWIWELSPTHQVKVILTPDGGAKLHSTSLKTMTTEDFEVVRACMTAMGDSIVQPDASWVESANFRLAGMVGSWDPKSRSSLHLELEGADDLGTAQLAFSSTSTPNLEGEVVAVHGEIAHTRWDQHRVSFEGRTTLVGKVISAWSWPATNEAVFEVGVLGRTRDGSSISTGGLHVAALPCSKISCCNELSSTDSGGALACAAWSLEPSSRHTLVLAAGEYVQRVCGLGGCQGSASGPAHVEVCTNQGRVLCWPMLPSSPDTGPSFEFVAPEFCEVIEFAPNVCDGPGTLSCRPLALSCQRPFELQRLPEGVWEGQLELEGQRAKSILCDVTCSGKGVFEASLKDVGPGASTAIGALESGKFSSSSGSAQATLLGEFGQVGHGAVSLRVEGRCAIDGARHVLMVLVSDSFPTGTANTGSNFTRIVLRSRARTLASDHLALTLDGSRLIHHAPEAASRYTMHAAWAPWTQQIAADCLVAELVVEQLAVVAEAGSLAVGLSTPRPGGGVEPMASWPGNARGRWLWRSDGVIAHVTAGEQCSLLWCYRTGDIVGFAVGARLVSFLRNGECVHTVPRHVHREAEPLAVGGAPTFFVGLFGCNAVLQLRKGAQYPHLCFHADTSAPVVPKCSSTLAASPSRPQESGQASPNVATVPPQRRPALRTAGLVVVSLCRLARKAFGGPMPLEWRGGTGVTKSSSSVVGSGVKCAREADIWVETTLVGTEARLKKGRTLLEELGGERRLKRLLADFCTAQTGSAPSDEAEPAMSVRDLYVNELDPADEAGPYTSARVSARFGKGPSERFRQARLECRDGCWKVAELHGDRSGRCSLCEGARHVQPGSEVVTYAVEDNWIKATELGSSARAMWSKIEDEDGGRRFMRKCDLVVPGEPVFSRPELVSLTRNSLPGPSSATEDAVDLPFGDEPFTVEACVKVSREENGREMCVATWVDDCGGLEHGLSLFDVAASASCSLKGTKQVCDGEWHHIACTFDGRERRLWTDFEPVACDVPEVGQAVGPVGKSKLFIGAYPPGLAKSKSTPGAFCGDVKRLRIWRGAVAPAILKAYAVTAEARVRDEVADEAAVAVFKGMDTDGCGRLKVGDIHAVFGTSSEDLIWRLHGEGSVEAETTAGDHRGISQEGWLRFCGEIRDRHGEPGLMRFLQACVRNLGQLGRPLRSEVVDWKHAVEVPAELSLRSASFGWRVEAKPVSLSDSMLEHIKDEGLEHYRRQVQVAHALLGRSADEAIVELADRVALQQGSHDDCWTKPIAATEWSQAQPRWIMQAVAQTRLDEMCAKVKLQQVLAWALATGRDLSEALEPPFRARVSAEVNPRVGELRALAVSAGGSSDACAELAAEILPGEVAAGPQGVIDSMFQDVVGKMLFVRFLVILELNWNVGRDFLPLIDLASPAGSAYGRLLAQVKPRLLGHLKFSQFQKVLQTTKYEGTTPGIILNRKMAVSLREKGRVDWEFRRSLIGQFIAEFRKQSIGPKLFRRPWQARCMKVQFKGEGGEDAGGLYREALDSVAQELHSRAVPLFVPCPNAAADVGDNRDAWLTNPRASTPECIHALEFVGQLIGLALRTGDLLPLSFAPFTWKGLVGDERSRDDVRSIDVFAEKHLAILFNGQTPPDQHSLFGMGGLQFAYPDVTGEEVELIEGGRDIGVTASNAPEFARLLLENRLTFDRLQLQALRRGLATVVPIQLLRLWRWRDLQERVCGVAEVDIENLKRHTTYKNCASTSEHIGYMWEALESFSQKQRRSFLRFVWGRSSLPTVEKWERNFNIQLLAGTDDSRLPCSHTCFFTLDLPMYSTVEVCHAKLLYCITHCLAIDADGAAARTLNWDEDDED